MQLANKAAANTGADADAIPSWRQRPYQQVKASAVLMGTSPGDVYRKGKDGVLELVRLGGRTLVTTSSLIAYLGSAEPWTPSKRGEAGRRRRTELAASRWR